MSLTQISQRQIADGAINDAKIAAGAGILSSKLADGGTGTQSMGGQILSNVGTPAANTDAATKSYVDTLYNTFPNLFKYKDEVKALMTINVTISNPGTSTFDGVTFSAGDRIALIGQTAGAENGIYVFNGSSAALIRATDADSFAEIAGSLFSSAITGTSNGSKVVLFTNAPGGTLGITVVTSTIINATPGLSASNFVDKETPTGSINGSNVTFTLANTPVSGSEHVYLNGALQDVGAGNDYTISSAVITLLTAPLTGEKIRVSYRR